MLPTAVLEHLTSNKLQPKRYNLTPFGYNSILNN
jgi:hypothetical protein